MNLILQNISLPLGHIQLKLNVECPHRITGLFGPSGAGKTSLLEVIAGLRHPATAFIQLGTHVLADTAKGIHIPTEHRAIGYVPQDLALFPHLSVLENIRYGSPSSPSVQLPVEHIVEVLEISSLLDRKIQMLSGGEKQRVAFARALLASPRLLLMDEPLASLDQSLKERIIPHLLRIRDEFHIPMLYVSHDAGEIISLCDEVLVLDRGTCVQKGIPGELFAASTRPHHYLK